RTIDAWIEKGKFDTLLDMWVKGMPFDWRKLHAGKKPKRVSLPGYPFARERYWVQAEATNAPARPGAMLHPLVQRNTSGLHGLRFTSELSGNEFFLADHVVQGQRILPGVAQLEMARHAAGEVFGGGASFEIGDVTWIRPVAVGAGGLTLHIALYPEDDGAIAYEIRGEAAGGGNEENGEAPLYSQGLILERDAEEGALSHDLAALRGQCSDRVLSAQQCYAEFAKLGLQYGPAFQGLHELFIGKDRLLARIGLPALMQRREDSNRYGLHPSLLDAALQATMGLQMAHGGMSLMLPFALASFEELAPCGAEMWAVVRRSAGSSAADTVQKIDIDLCDTSGTVCLRFHEFSMRAAAPTEAPSFDGKLLLAPVWDVVDPALLAAPSAGRMVVMGGTPAQHEALLREHAQAVAADLPTAAEVTAIEAALREYGTIDHIVWIVGDGGLAQEDDGALIAAQEEGVIFGFRLVKALLALGFGTRPLHWTVLTSDAQAVHGCDTIAPAHAGVHGFIGTMAKEFRGWQLRLIDLQREAPWPWHTLFRLPYAAGGDALAWRSGQWFSQRLLPLAPEADGGRNPAYRQGGVYVVIGGAGGIGQAWSEHVIRHHRAQVVWIGRRAPDETIEAAQARLGALGPAPLYISADAADLGAMLRAREEILARFGAIHGVMHAAIALLDRGLAQMDEDRMRAGLAAKVHVSVRMVQAFGILPLDFMLFCSSLLSFMKAAGQSNYAAGCTFKDAYCLHLAGRMPYPVKAMNWGYWGSVGVVASDLYRERMARQGIASIEADEGMEALDA
ncbi:MAG TPA: SDR family oxidoreductase, partial [Burkholderiaceae bacterium]